MLGGNTPQYFGAAQPAAERGGAWFGDDTPVYLACPSPMTMPQSATSSGAMALQAEPQPGQLAIVVPRS
jgi:hypothetical protein